MRTDYLIIGGGIIGLTTAYYLAQKYPQTSILIIDKENSIAKHASGRNSGVLHAGLYYASDSMRARYCVLGARKMREYSIANNIEINQCGKVVVAANQAEALQLKKLYQQALANGVRVHLIDEKELAEIEPTARTTEQAIYSPDTASFNSLGICQQLSTGLTHCGVEFKFNCSFVSRLNDNSILSSHGPIEYHKLINCGGIYADKIAQQFGVTKNYTLIPFKGVFLYCEDLLGNYSKHIYPVPNQTIKVLGVHFSPEYNRRIKIGPTAIPCLARENYTWLSNLRFAEMKEIIATEFKLLVSNQFNFRDLALAELKKQTKSGLINSAKGMVKDIKQFRFGEWGVAGIQPRLYDIEKQQIKDDFLIETTKNTVHIINSVSPAFTAAFAFSDHVVKTYL